MEISKINEGKFLKEIKKIYSDAKITNIDGIKIDLKDKWMHIRSSNTEPIIRIIAEAKSKKEAKELIKDAIDIITK